MTLSLLTAGVRLPVSKLSLLSGSLRPLKALKVMQGGSLRTVAAFAAPISVAANPDFVSGYASNIKPTRVVSDFTTATVSGGAAPYSYAWSIGGGITVSSPTNATTSFNATFTAGSRIGTATCIVTDAFGATASCQVSIELTNDGGF